MRNLHPSPYYGPCPNLLPIRSSQCPVLSIRIACVELPTYYLESTYSSLATCIHTSSRVSARSTATVDMPNITLMLTALDIVTLMRASLHSWYLYLVAPCRERLELSTESRSRFARIKCLRRSRLTLLEVWGWEQMTRVNYYMNVV